MLEERFWSLRFVKDIFNQICQPENVTHEVTLILFNAGFLANLSDKCN